jgi:FdhE protein
VEFIAQRRKRLEQLRSQRPQLAEIFDFYGEWYAFLAPRTAAVLSCTQAPGAARLEQGLPLLQGDNLAIDQTEAIALLQGLLAILQRHGREGQADLQRIAQALAEGHLDPAGLFGAYLQRDRYPLVKGAEGLGVPCALLEYVLGLACSFALQQAREAGLQPPTPERSQLHCPLCGGAPIMGELVGEEGRMELHCGSCGQSWPGARRQCCSCGNRDEASLEYFTAGQEPGYRVNICRQCSGYLKVVDSRVVGEGLPMDLEDLATLQLDLLAQREGFSKGKQAPVRETQQH